MVVLLHRHGPVAIETATSKGETMPAGKSLWLKDLELYEELRQDGASKGKAARISNAAAKEGRSTIGRKGGESGDYEDWTVERLRSRAKSLVLRGYSKLCKRNSLTPCGTRE